MTTTPNIYDVAIVGGGPTGQSAALILARACHRVVLCQFGEPANFAAPASYGVLTRDGIPPEEFSRLGLEDLKKYDSIDIRDEEVTSGTAIGNVVELTLASGSRLVARKIILATGVYFEPPDIPGLASFWPKSVFRCPYCHAWEYRGQPMAILASSNRAYELAILMRCWTDKLIICTQGADELEPGQRLLLSNNGVRILQAPVVRLAGADGQLQTVHFADRRVESVSAMVVCIPAKRRTELPTRLGIVKNDEIQLTALGATSNPNIFLAGDFTERTPPKMIVSAMYSGLTIGQTVSEILATERFHQAIASTAIPQPSAE